MLKVKKTKHAPSNKIKYQINQMQNEIKDSIGKMHLESKTKTKIINEYADLLTRIRKENEELYKENQKLKMTNQQLEKQQSINLKKTNNK